MKEFPHQTTAAVTAAILLAILGLAVNSDNFENGIYAQTTGCFNIGDCFFIYSPPSRAEIKNDWSCLSTGHMPSWHAQEQLYAFLPFALFFHSYTT